MDYPNKDQRWVFHEKTEAQETAPGVVRRVLAYCDNVMCVENGAVALANIFAGRQPYFLPKMASKSVTAPIPFYKRSSFIDIPFGMPYFKLFYF